MVENTLFIRMKSSVTLAKRTQCRNLALNVHVNWSAGAAPDASNKKSHMLSGKKGIQYRLSTLKQLRLRAGGSKRLGPYSSPSEHC